LPRAAMRIEEIFRAEHGRILATLIRVLGDFDVAEKALQEAFEVALEQWPAAGMPDNPVAWLIGTARHKAVDRLRRRARLAQKQDEIARHLELLAEEEEAPVPEDRLRLIFTCCHPALATEAQVALTLRTLGGVSTEEIARAFLVPDRARHKAIDRLRRRDRLAQKQDEIARHLELLAEEEEAPVPEDRLRLIFTCCHPALATEAQVALTLRTLGGLSTEEIARAFLVPVSTMAQRLVRAKAKIRVARFPYEVPLDEALAARLEAVLMVVYLVFNEGYAASFGDRLVRHDLCAQAIRLGRMLVELLPAHAEPKGLLALMLLHDSRRESRLDGAGEIVL